MAFNNYFIMKLKDIFKDNNNTLEIKVTPNANSDKIVILEEDGCYQVKVYVTVSPEDGKANNQVVKLLSKELKIPKSKINIIKGMKSRNKTVMIDDQIYK